MKMYQYSIFADYFQFSLEDDEREIDINNIWSEQEIDDMLCVGDGFIFVGTVRNMIVSVKIEVWSSTPSQDYHEKLLHDADHVTECSLEILSGRLLIAGPTSAHPELISVDTSVYEVKIYYFNLNTLSEDGLDGDDSYHVVMYPGTKIRPYVLKRNSETPI